MFNLEFNNHTGNKMDNLDKIFEFTKISNKLKQTKRWLHTPTMIDKESTAAHSWHLALLVPIIASEFKLDLDICRRYLAEQRGGKKTEKNY